MIQDASIMRSSSKNADIKPSHTVQQMAGKLMALVRTLPQGTKVPTVRTLMKEFGVSQLLVSQALLILRERGYLSAHVGRGTFVTEGGANLPVLWVCGTDIYHGQIGTFWGHCFTATEVAFRAMDIPIVPVWLSNFRPKDCEPYVSRMSLDRYRGFMFVGCADDHPLSVAVRNAKRPCVRFTYDEPESGEVTGDFNQMLATAMARVKAVGHRVVTVIHPEDSGPTRQWARIQSSAKAHGLQLRKATYPVPWWTQEAVSMGYETAKRLLADEAFVGGVLIQDEVVAAGATRAMLECCSRDRLRKLHVVVACPIQEISALGMPVDFVSFDTREIVSRGIEILQAQWDGGGGPDRWAVPYRLIPSKDAARVAAECAITMTAVDRG